MATQRISRKAITPRREYAFSKMKVGDIKAISIPPSDPVAGTRALTAAYAFARRKNDSLTLHSRKRVKFAGRLSKTKRVMNIHRMR